MCIQYRVLPQTVGDQQPSVQLGDITSSMCIQYRVLPQTVGDQQPSVQLGDIYMLQNQVQSSPQRLVENIIYLSPHCWRSTTFQYNWEILPVTCVFSTESSPRPLEIHNLSVQLGDITSNKCIQYRVLPQTIKRAFNLQQNEMLTSSRLQYQSFSHDC